MASVLDFIIRHQFPILFLPSSIISVLAIFMLARRIVTRANSQAYAYRDSLQYRGYGARSLKSRFFLSKYFWIVLGCIAVATVFFVCRSKPIENTAALIFPSPLRSKNTNDKLIVFVHGWRGDPEQTWQKFPMLVCDDPAFASYDLVSINYPTYLFRRDLSVSQMARWINENLATDASYAKYKEVSIIAHSLGGIISREVIIGSRLRSNDNKFKRLIEIGTPHKGANLATLASSIGLSRNLGGDIAKDAPFLRDLREHWDSLKQRPETFCITSPSDSIVDSDSATANCDRSFAYPDWGHIDLVKPQNIKDSRYIVPMSRL